MAAALATTLMLAPAQWLADAVLRASGGRVGLAETNGTVWNGTGTLMLAAGSDSANAPVSLPSPVHWTLSAWALLRGTVELAVDHPAALEGSLRLRAHANGAVQVDAITARLPAAMLSGLGAPWNTVKPGGILVIHTDGLQISPGHMDGSVGAEWEYASSALTPVSPIGHYRLQTSGPYPGTRVELQTLSGPLELTGSGTIAEGGRLRFQGLARPLAAADPATRTQLTGLISLLGRRDGEAAILSFGI
jgi:general secretion pathway protein N